MITLRRSRLLASPSSPRDRLAGNDVRQRIGHRRARGGPIKVGLQAHPELGTGAKVCRAVSTVAAGRSRTASLMRGAGTCKARCRCVGAYSHRSQKRLAQNLVGVNWAHCVGDVCHGFGPTAAICNSNARDRSDQESLLQHPSRPFFGKANRLLVKRSCELNNAFQPNKHTVCTLRRFARQTH